jgi:aspartokinase/homoserine dehydrogenase 1
MKVLKFGGSSIGTVERIKNVKKIIEGQDKPCIIVVSALQGVTDQLISITTKAKNKDNTYLDDFQTLAERHYQVVKELFDNGSPELVKKVQSDFLELSDILNGVFLLQEMTPKIQDAILSYGEKVSSYIISHVISNAIFIDSRDFIKTDNNHGNARVDNELTTELIKKQFKGISKTPVIPGFIASTKEGVTTTLGRGGSDYTSAIVASALDAEVLEIWSDVDGFMTADPRKVSKAKAIDKMSYSEAIELSHFGAKVIYTPTIQPVYKKNIPILLKNTFNPSVKGTLVSKETGRDCESLIKGISSIDDINLITIQGPGMVGVPGTSMRLFGAIAKSRVNIILITQASSEYSITFAIKPDDTEKAVSSINDEFKNEISYNNEINIVVEKDLSIIAIVGEQMKNTPGISARLFRAMAKNGISVIATAQGSSELNISVAIKKESLNKALNSIHEEFFLTGYKELNLFVVGTGTVGGALLEQIHMQREKLMKSHHLKLNVVGMLNVYFMAFDENGLQLADYNGTLEKSGIKSELDAFVAKMKSMNLRNSVFIDCTASPDVAKKYPEVLDSFISVVAANKIANSSEYSLYKQLKDIARSRNVRFMYETNVGAGLPVITTINDLMMSGDGILKIEAVLSGTLNFIFNTISKDIPLSRTVELAKEKGYSEPDPRIDLSGTDVIRKILILARESGYALEKSDVEVNTFLPKECFDGTLDDFWKNIKKYDEDFEKRRKVLESENKRWRFVARLDNGKASVQLVEVDFNHPAYVLEGSNNIIILTTERYKELPMVIKGYGAGAGVTAAGVFADILRVANV